MGVCYFDDVDPVDLVTVDAAVVQARNGVVADLNEKAMGTVEIERELLGPIGRELVAACLG